MFDKQSFFEAYRSDGSNATLEFLEDFSERPAFGAPIERWIDEKDPADLFIFKNRLEQLKNGQKLWLMNMALGMLGILRKSSVSARSAKPFR